MNQYYIWLNENHKKVGRPKQFHSLDDIDWEHPPKGGKCIVKGGYRWLVKAYKVRQVEFLKWEYPKGESDGTGKSEEE
jgi:hypothetical protein